jgi:PhnB protein
LIPTLLRTLFSETKTMPAPVERVPEGFHTVTPHLTVRDGMKLIEFYKQAFGAKEWRRSVAPDGKSLLHAELSIGDSRIFLNDEFPEMGALSPLGTNGTPVQIHLYVEDVDSLYQSALSAGAKVVMPLADQFWGDLYGVVEDPSGHRWALASHVRDMTPDQMKQAAAEMFGDKKEV